MDKFFKALTAMVQPRLTPVLVTNTGGFLMFADEADGVTPDAEEAPEKPAAKEPEKEPEKLADEELGKLTPAELAKLLAAKDKRISELNQESAERRRKLKQYEEEEEARKAAAMTDLEKAQQSLAKATEELAELKSINRTLELTAAVEKHILKVDEVEYRLIDPQDFLLVVPAEKGRDDIPALIEDLFSKKPHYFTKLKTDLPETDSPGPENRQQKNKKKEVPLPPMKL